MIQTIFFFSSETNIADINHANSTRGIFKLPVFSSILEHFQTVNILEFVWQKVQNLGTKK